MTTKHRISIIAWLFTVTMIGCFKHTNAQNAITDSLRVYWANAEKYDFVEPDTALIYFKKINVLLNKKELKKYLSDDSIQKFWIKVNQSIATCYNIIGQYDTAFIYYENTLIKARECKDTAMILACISNRAIAYMNSNQQDKALNSYLEVIETVKDNQKYEKQLAASYNNIGTFYESRSAVKDLNKALEYRRKALEIYEKFFSEKQIPYNERSLALGYTNIGLLFYNIKSYDSAYYYAQKAIPLQEKLQDWRALSATLNLISDLYEKDSIFDQALQYQLKSVDYAKRSGYTPVYVERINDLADLYITLAKNAKNSQRENYLKQAIQLATESYDISAEIGLLFDQHLATEKLSDAYMMLNNHKEANKYLLKKIELKEALHSEEAADNVYKIENKYISERNQLLQKDKETTDKLMKNRERTLMIVVIGSVLLFAMLVVIYQRMRMVSKQRDVIAEQNDLITQQKEEVEAQKELIIQQKEEVEAQRDFANKQHKEIQSSISYAKRLQNAVLPDLPPELPMFVLYLPRDIVSGDFYWCSQHGNTMLLAVADCTGHGVPGACMSMLGLSYLREISLLHPTDTPAQMLDSMRQKVITALGQTGAVGEARDGMDVTICKYDTNTAALEFASAYNPLLVIPQTGEPYTIKGDRQPVAYYTHQKPFSNQTLQLQPGDSFYMMSDGLKDLFNANNQKFSYKRIVSILDEMRSAPMPAQLERLLAEADSWANGTKQTDDMTLMGFRCPEIKS